jgi:hypothetical protein
MIWIVNKTTTKTSAWPHDQGHHCLRKVKLRQDKKFIVLNFCLRASLPKFYSFFKFFKSPIGASECASMNI